MPYALRGTWFQSSAVLIDGYQNLAVCIRSLLFFLFVFKETPCFFQHNTSFNTLFTL